MEENFARLLARLEADFPKLRFRPGKKFAFRPPRSIIYEECVEDEHKNLEMQLLHEMGHAILGHRSWGMDLERVKMESAAWVEAEKLCERYGVKYDEEFAEGELDSYRDWLYARSTCEQCGLTMYQTPDGEYHCPQCEMYRK